MWFLPFLHNILTPYNHCIISGRPDYLNLVYRHFRLMVIFFLLSNQSVNCDCMCDFPLQCFSKSVYIVSVISEILWGFEKSSGATASPTSHCTILAIRWLQSGEWNSSGWCHENSEEDSEEDWIRWRNRRTSYQRRPISCKKAGHSQQWRPTSPDLPMMKTFPILHDNFSHSAWYKSQRD